MNDNAQKPIKLVRLIDFLTNAQIEKCAKLITVHGMEAAPYIDREVTRPNLKIINLKIGQENDARYLAYMIIYVFSQAGLTA